MWDSDMERLCLGIDDAIRRQTHDVPRVCAIRNGEGLALREDFCLHSWYTLSEFVGDARMRFAGDVSLLRRGSDVVLALGRYVRLAPRLVVASDANELEDLTRPGKGVYAHAAVTRRLESIWSRAMPLNAMARKDGCGVQAGKGTRQDWRVFA